MHDWTLMDVVYEWGKEGSGCVFKFRWNHEFKYLKAHNVFMLSMPRNEDWGSSASVNSVKGPLPDEKGQKMEIEMQSGDVIVLIASKIDLPK